MNGFTEHQASDASDSQGRRDVIFTWGQAQKMLPLIRNILEDLTASEQRRSDYEVEKAQLDRARHSLGWPERSRRYQLGEEIELQKARVQQASAELGDLGVILTCPILGQVGFPTIVNNRKAVFSWRLGEENVDNWHFARTTGRREIPESWKEEGAEHAGHQRKKSRKQG